MHRDPSGMSLYASCEDCMRETTTYQRQVMGCGWEPSLAVGVTPWKHPGQTGPEPTKCPGYTTRLPVVREVGKTRVHWLKGSAGELTELMRDALEVLDDAVSELEAWMFKNPTKASS